MNNSMEQQLDIPEWLTENDHYIPKADKDTFVNKSILSVFKVIARIKMQDINQSQTYVHVSLKVFFTFVLLLLLSITRSFVFVIIVNVYLLLLLSLIDADSLVKILKMSLGVTLFTAIIMLPAIIWRNYYSCIMITSKIFATVTTIGLLSHTTKWNDITGALRRFHIPGIFILILDITIKYMYLLGDLTLNMLYALKLRSVGKNRNKYMSMAGIAGSIFLQSKEMAEDMYHAMECRCFTGEYPIYNKSKFKWMDYLYILLNVGFIILFIYFVNI